MCTAKVSTEDVIDELHAYMDDALEMLEKGEYVELLTLKDRVEFLCHQVSNLPVDEAMKHKDNLAAMIERLDNLKTFMEAHKELLGDQIGNLGGSKAAAHAYQKSNHILPFPKKDDEEND